LSVVFTHVLIISSAEADDTLFTFMANIYSDKHCLFRDFISETESPKISSKLGIDLSKNVNIDPIIVFLDGLAGNELGNNWTVSVNLVLQSCIKMLLLDGIWHDD